MIMVHSKVSSTDGLVGYDTALTRRGSRVQFPLCVMVLIFLIFNYKNME